MSTGGEPAPRVLVVEDEGAIRQLVVHCLRDEGYDVVEAEDALAATEQLATVEPDLVLLDLNLPGISGQEFLVRVRRASQVPIIVLSGRAAERDRVDALRNGADDYVVKPFSIDEFLARVASVLRRSKITAASRGEGPLRFGELEIDLVTREVRVGGDVVELTAREFNLLAFMAASPKQVFNRGQLLEHVWGSSSEWQDPATVTEHIRRIRRKVEDDPDNPRFLQTVRSVGYRFQP